MLQYSHFLLLQKKENNSNTTKQRGGHISQGTNMTSHGEVSHHASDWELSQDSTDSHLSGPRTNSSYIMLENDS